MFILRHKQYGFQSTVLIGALFFIALQVKGQEIQEKRERFPSFFCFNASAMLPNNFQESKTIVLEDSLTKSIVNQGVGRSLGAYLRRSYTDRFSIEFGVLYSSRNFTIDMEILDSNLKAKNNLKFTSYDIPLNGLIFLRLSKNIYGNAGMGATFQYRPSAVATLTKPNDKNSFIHAGLLTDKFAMYANGQFGVELRTEKSGIIYLGGSARIPFSNLFIVTSSYQYGTAKTFNAAEVKAGYFAVDVRYFFPNIKNKGKQPLSGPGM